MGHFRVCLDGDPPWDRLERLLKRLKGYHQLLSG
jgi:hypothetical protein